MGYFDKNEGESWEDMLARLSGAQNHAPMSDEQYRETLAREITNMGWALGLVYRSFCDNGFTEEQAFQLTNSYMLRTSGR